MTFPPPRPSALLATGRFLNQDAQVRVRRLGMKHTHHQDLYHWLLTIDWLHFLGLIAAGYVLANLLFATAFWLQPGAVANARPGSFSDIFYFSIQTMGSIGYGYMYPQTDYAHFLVAVESLSSLLAIAMGTGLMFARFARPTARVMFSQVAVVTPVNGVPTLMFRTANQRYNQILEAQLWVSLARNEVSTEGEFMRRFYDLKLVRHRTAIFGLSWTAMHPIDASSPLYGVTPETLAHTETEIIISLSGIDETFSQTIHARHAYLPRQVLWQHRFVDIFHRVDTGGWVLDYRRFHDVTDQSSL